jgi:hypothetical protein
MSVSATDTAPEVVHGILQRIDLINREVTLRTEQSSITFSVSADCEVLLNGERVKLRLLQPRDRARISYCSQEEGWAAASVEARTRSSRNITSSQYL